MLLYINYRYGTGDVDVVYFNYELQCAQVYATGDRICVDGPLSIAEGHQYALLDLAMLKAFHRLKAANIGLDAALESKMRAAKRVRV